VPLFGQGPDRPVGIEPMAGRETSVDPLDFFGPPQKRAAPPPASEPDHVPSHSEFFAPPHVHPDPLLGERSMPPPAPSAPSAPSTSASGIPENWDDTSFTAQVPKVGNDPLAPFAAPAPPPAVSPAPPIPAA